MSCPNVKSSSLGQHAPKAHVKTRAFAHASCSNNVHFYFVKHAKHITGRCLPHRKHCIFTTQVNWSMILETTDILLIFYYHRGINTDFWFWWFCMVCRINFPTFREPLWVSSKWSQERKWAAKWDAALYRGGNREKSPKPKIGNWYTQKTMNTRTQFFWTLKQVINTLQPSGNFMYHKIYH
jgi:hypothetical protein